MKIHNLAFLLFFQFSFVWNEALEFLASSPTTDTQQKLNGNKSGLVNIVFKSSDGGQTWQDISEGLPENLQEDGVPTDGFFADDSGLYLRAENGVYHSKPNSTAWKKESFTDKHSGYVSQFLQKTNGKSLWTPMYTNFREKEVDAVFETTGGTVFIGFNNGLFKSADSGKTWKQVYSEGSVMKLVESNGVLMTTSGQGILRSTDDGENWDLVISEGGVGIAIECIKGGFAAITYNTASKTRRVRTSYDGGKTWQPIDAGLPAQASITSIIQVGEYFFCGHPTGIFRSSDKGKTWELVLPSLENKVFNLSVSGNQKVFNLFVSGNVIYAIPRNGGC